MATRAAIVAILSAMIALVAAGCGGSSSTDSTRLDANASFYTGGTPGGSPQHGGTVIIDRSEAPESLDPLLATSSSANVTALAGFDQLVETFPGSDKEPQPGLASSWNVSPDGLTVTFHIRPGVRFSNGEPLTGEDVVYSLRRFAQPTASSHYLSTLWQSVSLASPMTVQVQLKKPAPAFIDDLTLGSASVVPKKLVEKEGEKQFALHPVGTGPFKVTSATAGNSTVTMARNPHYWRAGQPYLDGVVWNQVAEANARALAVRSGTATIATGIPFSQVESLKKAPGTRLLIEPESGSMVQIFNDGIAPFDESAVRKALAYATPRQAIIKSVFAGLGLPSNNVFGDKVKYWDPNVPTFPYDIAKAKQSLKESSVPHGFDMTITIPSGEPTLSTIASIEQSAWARIGVHVKIQAAPFPSAIADYFAGKYQSFIFPPESSTIETYYPDASALVAEDYPDSGNHATGTNYNSPRVVALIRKAISSTSESERSKLFREIQYLVNFKEAAYLPIAFLPSVTLVGSSLRGFEVPPTGYLRMERAWLQK